MRVSNGIVATVAAVCLGVIGGAAGPARAGSTANYQPLPDKVRHELAVPTHVLDRIGRGGHGSHRNIPPRIAKTATIRSHGKPELAYILAEWCPFCAGESWSLAVALSRFGEFSNLTTLSSGSLDKPANLQTISFRYAKYHSRYLHFAPIVYADPDRPRVDKVPPRIGRVWRSGGAPGFPWIDFGGKALLSASSFSPTVIAHRSRGQIAIDLGHRHRTDGKAIDGTANQLTAAICVMTSDKPATVCESRPIAKIERSLSHGRH
jgi:hypothetical protein